MKKYFYLQIKRILKAFPFILIVSVCLFLGLTIVLSSVVTSLSNSDENKQVNIAITGDTDSDYIKWGITALESLDETRFSVKFLQMTEDKAQKALSSGDITAYVILPENFFENAMMGNITPVTYVTSPGATGIATMFKNEVTKLITDVLVYSQKGTYGVGGALSDNGYNNISDKYLNEMSVEYVDLILSRNQFYTVEELTASNSLSITDYFICGLTILLLMLIGLPYVTIYTKKDYSLNSLMVSRGYKNAKMLICEYLAHLISVFALLCVILCAVLIGAQFMSNHIFSQLSFDLMLRFALYLLPVIIMLSMFNIMLYELSDNIVSAVLLHFFLSLSICYVSGCMYPIYTFPVAIQKLSVFLPAGLSRSFVSGCFINSFSVTQFVGIMVYTLVFYFIALAVRSYKTANKRG